MEFKASAVLTKSGQISAIYWPLNVEKNSALLVSFLETVTTAFKTRKVKKKIVLHRLFKLL